MAVRLLLEIEYDGTSFSGWQQQPGQRTVQGELEKTLAELTGRTVEVTGAGRTDAGVHAAGQAAHLDAEEKEVERITSGLDRLLPDDIGILRVRTVPSGFHARYSARSRTYSYRIAGEKHPLSCRYEHLHLGGELDTGAMNLAAAASIGTHDWRAMAREGSGNTTWISDVTAAHVTEDPSGWTLTITANRFLRGMVRIWAGTLKSIGLGSSPPELITTLLETGNRDLAGPSLPARGLTLLNVRYDPFE